MLTVSVASAESEEFYTVLNEIFIEFPEVVGGYVHERVGIAVKAEVLLAELNKTASAP